MVTGRASLPSSSRMEDDRSRGDQPRVIYDEVESGDVVVMRKAVL